MRIGFDARYIRWDHHDGISRFSTGLAHELALLMGRRTDDELVFIISDDRQRALLPPGETVSVTSPTSWREPWVARHLNSADLDVVFSPTQTRIKHMKHRHYIRKIRLMIGNKKDIFIRQPLNDFRAIYLQIIKTTIAFVGQ